MLSQTIDLSISSLRLNSVFHAHFSLMIDFDLSGFPYYTVEKKEAGVQNSETCKQGA